MNENDRLHFKFEIDYHLPLHFGAIPKETISMILDEAESMLKRMSCVCSLFANTSSFLDDGKVNQSTEKYQKIVDAMTEFVNYTAKEGIEALHRMSSDPELKRKLSGYLKKLEEIKK